MRWIDKSGNRVAGLQITSDYLNNHCLGSNGRHSNIEYRDRSQRCFCNADNAQYRKKLTQLLLSEQDNMCCYCLRRLKTGQREEWSDQTITLEHIIPQGFISGVDAAYYQTAPGLTPTEVEMTDVYESSGYNQQPHIHPHKVAYNNLVVSCNGTFPDIETNNGGKQKICCNVKRQQLPAYPIYFYKDVPQWVDYLRDGDVQAVINTIEEAHVSTLIASTNLQCDSLKDIRFMWYLLRREVLPDIYKCNSSKSKREYLLCKILFDNNIVDIERSIALFEKFKKDVYWDTLILYNEFYNIMNAKYP